jgi:integrase
MSHEKFLKGFDEEEFREKINKFNQEITFEFLDQQHLSSQTLKQYKSAIYIFFTFVYEKCMNKPIYELRPRDALKFQNLLISEGLSSSSIKFKRSAISSLCNFIELYYGEDYPNFRNIYNKAIPNVAKVNKKMKEPLTKKEVETLIKTLEEQKEYQKLAYLLYSFATGCRREESRQLLKEVITYDKFVNKKGETKDYYVTHEVRAKGRGKVGKVRKFQFDERAMVAIKKWIEIRGEDDCPFVFATKSKDSYKQVSANTFNLWCDHFSEILGKKVHPHLLRSSRATISVVEEGKDIKAVQSLLGHESSQTTEIYIVRDNDESLDDLF